MAPTRSSILIVTVQNLILACYCKEAHSWLLLYNPCLSLVLAVDKSMAIVDMILLIWFICFNQSIYGHRYDKGHLFEAVHLPKRYNFTVLLFLVAKLYKSR